MIKLQVAIIIALCAVYALPEVAAVKGKCIDSTGNKLCGSSEVCVRGRRPRYYRKCDPLDSHNRCRCLPNHKRGCTDLLRENICADNQQCVYRSGNVCRRERSPRCRCRDKPATEEMPLQAEAALARPPPPSAAPPAAPPAEIGCRTFDGTKIVIIPVNARAYKVPDTCMQCDCIDITRTGRPPFQEWCRPIVGCIGFRLIYG